MSFTGENTSTVREALGVLRRRWPYIVGAVLVGLVAAAIASYTTQPRYEATTDLTYVKQQDISSALTGSTVSISTVDVQREIETYADLMSSEEMRAEVQEVVGADDWNVLGAEVAAEYVADTSILRISVTAPNAHVAQRVAQGYADAFVARRREAIVSQYRAAERIVEQKIKSYSSAQVAAQDSGYVELVQRLEDLRVLRAAATGNFVVAATAAEPTEPYTPQHGRDLAIGLAVGLLAGIGLAVLAEQLDVRLHTAEDLADALGLPVLARIPRTAGQGVESSTPATIADPAGSLAEAFRMFRTNLEFAEVGGRAGTVLFTSAVQGEGKSTTVANLAVAAALGGRRVIAVDADLRRAHLHHLFGLRNTSGLSSVLTGKTTLEQALQVIALPAGDREDDGAGAGSLRVLTSGALPPNPGEIAASERLGDLVATLATQADVVFIDAPPFLVVGDANALARRVDSVVVVARLGLVTRAMVRESREVLAKLPCRILGLAVTGIHMESAAYRYRYYERSEAAATAEAETARAGDTL